MHNASTPTSHVHLPGGAQPDGRSRALASLPDCLTPERLGRWSVVMRNEGIDETEITLMDVQHDDDDDAVCVQRQQWLFDEDTQNWVLEHNDEWWLSGEMAKRLAVLLAR
jgi:hypothetical protein